MVAFIPAAVVVVVVAVVVVGCNVDSIKFPVVINCDGILILVAFVGVIEIDLSTRSLLNPPSIVALTHNFLSNFNGSNWSWTRYNGAIGGFLANCCCLTPVIGENCGLLIWSAKMVFCDNCELVLVDWFESWDQMWWELVRMLLLVVVVLFEWELMVGSKIRIRDKIVVERGPRNE